MVDLTEGKGLKIKIALYQMNIQWEDKEANYLCVDGKLVEA